jgi:hypothetical protein
MIARAAESNASCFLPDKPLDTTTAVIPQLLRYVRAPSSRLLMRLRRSDPCCHVPSPAPQAAHFDNPFGNTKFLLNNYAASPYGTAVLSKAETKTIRSAAAQCKDYGALGRAFEFVRSADGGLVPASAGPATVEVSEEEQAMNAPPSLAAGGEGGLHPACSQPTDEVLGPVKEGIARRRREREQGVWALGGEEDRKAHEGEPVPSATAAAVPEAVVGQP